MRAKGNAIGMGRLLAGLTPGMVGFGSLVAESHRTLVGLALAAAVATGTWFSQRLAVPAAGARALRPNKYPWLGEQLQGLDLDASR